MNTLTHERFPGFRARIGVSRWDITPEAGIYSRNWGAAKQWFSTGVHRRLTATALAIAPLATDEPPLLLIGLDLGWWRGRKEADALRHRILSELNLPEANVILHLAHTHAGPALDTEAPPETKPDVLRAYLSRLADACVSGARDALAKLQPATTLFRNGHCSLATHRDFVDPAAPTRFVTGFNPGGTADDTLLVARIFTDDGRTIGTLVNYACHPTTLAWENTLLSPDYPGAMREVVEAQTNGAPCLFLLGAAGDLAPAEQYSGDVNLADRHGRELGHAALSALAPLATGCSHLRYDGVVESGAPLAMWQPWAVSAPQDLRAAAPSLPLPLKEDLPSVAEIEAALARKPEGFQYERLMRQRRVRMSVGEGPASHERIWLWRMGESLLCATPFEAYSVFQKRLREAFPGLPILVLNLANGSPGYVPPRELYDHNLYTVWQTPFARGCAELILDCALTGLRELRAD